MGGRASDRPVLSLFPPAFAALNPNERTPTAHSRCIQNSPHEPHAHPTPNTDTKPKYLPRPKPTLKRRFRSLKALFLPHPPRPVHVALAHLPLPPSLSMCTWTRWYAAAQQLHGMVGKHFDVGREGELGEDAVGEFGSECCAWLNIERRW